MSIHPDLTTIVACLLHDTIDDGTGSLDDIRAEFGSDVARIVDEISNIGKIKYR